MAKEDFVENNWKSSISLEYGSVHLQQYKYVIQVDYFTITDSQTW